MIRTIVVDDEAKSRKLMQNLLSRYCANIKLVASADSVSSGLQAIVEHQPDLVFLDVLMRHENGFDLLDKVERLDFEVIFTTAYTEFAVRAFRVEALDYLVKPINIRELRGAVVRADAKLATNRRARKGNQTLPILVNNHSDLERSESKIGIPTQHGLKFVPIRDIVYCKALGNYTEIFLLHEVELVTRTLKQFELFLSAHNFCRIHRGYLINLDHVSEYSRFNNLTEQDGDGGSITLNDKTQLPVSREKKKAFLARLSRPF